MKTNSFLTHEEIPEDISDDNDEEVESSRILAISEVQYYDDLSNSYLETKNFLKNAFYYCVFENLSLQSYLTFCKKPQSLIRILQKKHELFLHEHNDIIRMLYPFSKNYCTFEQFENLVCRYSFIDCNCSDLSQI